MSEESTPLRQGVPRVGLTTEQTRIVSNLFRQENLENARSDANARVEELRQAARSGDVGLRLLGLLGGVALLLSAIVGFLRQIFSLHALRALFETYAFTLAIIMPTLLGGASS